MALLNNNTTTGNKAMTELHDFDNSYSGNEDFNWQGEDGCEGMMETFSPHIERVLEVSKSAPKTVWTIMDSEDDDIMVICAGYHHVGRVSYFISNEEWKEENEEYLWA